MKKLSLLAAGLLATWPVIATVQSPIDCHILFDGTNTVQIRWNAYPGKSYALHTSSNLLGDWTSSAPLVASSNSLSASLTVTAQAQFFKVVQLDTEGPDVLERTPHDGSIAVDRRATVSLLLADLNGINPNSLALKVGTNVPVNLADPRLTFAAGRLTYTPHTNEFLGDYGTFITNTLVAADTLGNSSTNVWSFQLALAPVTGTNIIFIGDGTQPRPQGDGLTLISTNGDTFTFSYSGAASGLSNGVHLVKSDLQTGFTRTVVSFTEYPASHTVVVLTRPTKLAELLQSGSLAAGDFIELPGDGPGPQGAGAIGLAFNYHFTLERVLYQDANLILGLTKASELDLRGTLDLNGNFDWFKLTSFEGLFGGRAAFTLEAYAQASGSYSRNGSVGLISPVRKIYGGFIGYVPVWVELVFEINAGYELTLAGSAGYTNGFTATKDIRVGRRWEKNLGWTVLWDNPDLGFTVLGPKWQVETTGNLQVYLQPKLTALVYSTAGAWADLKPAAELDARLQLNPYEFEAGLYAGLTSTLGLDLRVWDEDWGELPDHTFTLIPRTLLWEHSSRTAAPPQIAGPTGQPQPQAVSVGGTAMFSVQAGGATPLSYRWQRNGLNLTEGGRITGTRSSTLRIANAQTSDAGNYRVVVSNPNGSATSQSATLTVISASLQSGLVAYYPFNGNANDASGNGRHGIVYGAVPDIDRFGSPSGCFAFSGSGNWIRADIGPVFFGADFAISIWVNFSDFENSYPMIVSGDTYFVHCHGLGPVYGSQHRKIVYYGGSVGGIYSTEFFDTNRWYHICITRAGSTTSMYVNGALSGQDINSPTVSSSGSYLQIGNDFTFGQHVSSFHGKLDDFRIYNRALSASEVLSLYNSSLPNPTPASGMALIPAGSFTMGNAMDPNEGWSDELPLHTVYVSAFYMDKYEVTKALWDEVYHWAITHGYSFDNTGSGKGASHPVYAINWYDSVKWCNARSEREGRVPAYYTGAAQTTVYRSGQVDVQNDWVKWSAGGYRLPTEAEWEKAARGGVSGQRFPWGNTITHSQANYYSWDGYAYDISPTRGYPPAIATGGYPYTSPVGYFAANGYGLHDMAGNVWESCWDWYQGDWYGKAGASQNDTRGPTGPLSDRVMRGGDWYDVAYVARCANRGFGPDDAASALGFRCVRGL